MSKMKQSADKSSQEVCNHISSNESSDQTKYLKTNEDIIRDAEDGETEPLKKDGSDDSSSLNLKDTHKEDSIDQVTIEQADEQTTDHEDESDDKYWDTLTHVGENEVFQEDNSFTEEDTFWDCPTELEEATVAVNVKEEMKVRLKPESVSMG